MFYLVKVLPKGLKIQTIYCTPEKGTFILTLYEKRVNPDDLPFFLGLNGSSFKRTEFPAQSQLSKNQMKLLGKLAESDRLHLFHF